MESREQRAIEQFNEAVPRQLLRDLFVSILTNYQQADKFAKDNYPWQEGLAIRGYKRRADIEVDLPAVAAKYFGRSTSRTEQHARLVSPRSQNW